jgi:hypothetical protein
MNALAYFLSNLTERVHGSLTRSAYGIGLGRPTSRIRVQIEVGSLELVWLTGRMEEIVLKAVCEYNTA